MLFLKVGLLLTEGGMVVLPFMLDYLLPSAPGLYGTCSIWGLFITTASLTPALDGWQETLTMLLYNSDWLFIVLPLTQPSTMAKEARSSQPSTATSSISFIHYIWLLALVAAVWLNRPFLALTSLNMLGYTRASTP